MKKMFVAAVMAMTALITGCTIPSLSQEQPKGELRDYEQLIRCSASFAVIGKTLTNESLVVGDQERALLGVGYSQISGAMGVAAELAYNRANLTAPLDKEAYLVSAEKFNQVNNYDDFDRVLGTNAAAIGTREARDILMKYAQSEVTPQEALDEFDSKISERCSPLMDEAITSMMLPEEEMPVTLPLTIKSARCQGAYLFLTKAAFGVGDEQMAAQFGSTSGMFQVLYEVLAGGSEQIIAESVAEGTHVLNNPDITDRDLEGVVSACSDIFDASRLMITDSIVK